MAAAAIITSVISIVASAVSLAISLSAKQPSTDMPDSGVGIDRRGQDNPMLVPFGKCLVPLAQVYNNTNNTNTKYLTQLFSAGIGEVKSIQQIYINGVPFFPVVRDQAIGWHQQGISAEYPNVSVGLKKGKTTETNMFQPIIDNSDGEITASFRGDGICSVSVLAERWINTRGDNDIRFMGDKNRWEMLVEGNAVIDPRTDPNCHGRDNKALRTWGTSFRNPGCVILTYLLDTYYGLSYLPEDIDITSFILLCNWCDQQALYFDGFINQESTKGEIMEQFANTFGGVLYLESGLLRARVLDKSPAVASLNELNMLSEVKVLNSGASDYCNTIKVEYLNINSNYSQDQYVIPQNGKTDPTIAKDGFIKEKVLKLPYLADGLNGNYDQVQFFANRAMKTAQLVKKSISFKIDNTQTKLKLGDVVNISNVMFNMVNKPFRVISIKSSMDDKILVSEIECSEYIEEVYNRGSYVPGGSSGSLPDPSLIISPPSNLIFTQNTGTVQGNGILKWTAVYQGEQRNEVQYKKSASTEWVDYQTVAGEQVTVVNLETGTRYDFRVMCWASIGASRWTELLNVQIARVVNLPAVTGLVADFTGRDAIITWNAIKGPIDASGNPVQGYTDLSQLVSYYQVQIAHNTVSNVKSTHIVTDPTFVYTLDRNRQDGLSRNVFAIIHPVSIFGDVGAVANTNAYNEPMSQPAAVEVRSQLVNLTVQWLNPSDQISDYDATDLWVTEFKTNPPTSANYLASSTVGWWTQVLGGTAPKEGWIWVAHRDVYGHPSSGAVLSAPIYYKESSIDDLLTDSPRFDEIEQNLAEVNQELATQGGEITTLQNRVSLTETGITENKTLIETTNTKLAQLDTKVEAQGVVITDQTQAISQVDGKVNALRTIKLDVNGKVSGLQLGNDGTTSTVDFLTDVFRVSTGTNSQAVFEIRNGNTMIKNALIGNLTATQIQAGSITGNEISALSLIRVGSGASSASLSGQGDWRIYSGGTDPASAPFRVHSNGYLHAQNANIVGTITATSGSFTGTINAQGGSFTNAVWCGGNYISGHPSHFFLSSPNFKVDQSGNLTAVNATIRGVLSSADLRGDIYRKGYFNQGTSGNTILNGGTEHEFFRLSVGSQEFAQKITLNNVEVPFKVYDNPGKYDVYYQIEGQGGVWYTQANGPSGTSVGSISNFFVTIPAGATWVRFYVYLHNKCSKIRAGGLCIAETMKAETNALGFSAP
ncbi:phage tail tip fiber protein [Aeromonas sp. AE23HZ002T15]